MSRHLLRITALAVFQVSINVRSSPLQVINCVLGNSCTLRASTIVGPTPSSPRSGLPTPITCTPGCSDNIARSLSLSLNVLFQEVHGAGDTGMIFLFRVVYPHFSPLQKWGKVTMPRRLLSKRWSLSRAIGLSWLGGLIAFLLSSPAAGSVQRGENARSFGRALPTPLRRRQ
jgi:hypothetical protein